MGRSDILLSLYEKTNPFGNEKYIFLGKWVAETMMTIDEHNGKGSPKSIKYKELIKFLLRKYGKIIGVGSFRAVLTTNAGYVVKAPLCQDGEKDNHKEYELFKRSKNASHYASCKIATVLGFPVLFMEELHDMHRGTSGDVDWKVIDTQDPDDPYWIQKLDASQIGVSASGRLKAYDYASDAFGKRIK